MEQSWMDILIYVIEAIVGIVISIGIPMGIAWLKSKTKNETLRKLIDQAGATVTDCVKLVNQTYVDVLKREGKFDEAAAKEAYEICKNDVLLLLSKNAKEAITGSFGDIEAWLKVKIEATVRDWKIYAVESDK